MPARRPHLCCSRRCRRPPSRAAVWSRTPDSLSCPDMNRAGSPRRMQVVWPNKKACILPFLHLLILLLIKRSLRIRTASLLCCWGLGHLRWSEFLREESAAVPVLPPCVSHHIPSIVIPTPLIVELELRAAHTPALPSVPKISFPTSGPYRPFCPPYVLSVHLTTPRWTSRQHAHNLLLGRWLTTSY